MEGRLRLRFGIEAAARPPTILEDGTRHLTVAVITVDPNEILKSVGHHRSSALLRSDSEARTRLQGSKEQARCLLRPHESEVMGVEAMPKGIKIPGNEKFELPAMLAGRSWKEV